MPSSKFRVKNAFTGSSSKKRKSHLAAARVAKRQKSLESASIGQVVGDVAEHVVANDGPADSE